MELRTQSFGSIQKRVGDDGVCAGEDDALKIVSDGKGHQSQELGARLKSYIVIPVERWFTFSYSEISVSG